ncbi:nucleotidyltransferase domain-containing protein [Nocardioides sp. NPDC057577]|uniref:nucleotidyltransferase domain-containing protein n=1 Tax=Nocardioides sp. NPDC057577 TaxID=3346171 RepID=UPI00366B7AA1
MAPSTESSGPAGHPAVDALADRLASLPWVTGLYVAGSLASNDHVPGVSDLDLVALTDRPPDTQPLSSIHGELDAGVAAGDDLGCAYVDVARRDDPEAPHPTWTHGRLVHRPLTTIPRAELAVHGLTVFGEDVRTAFPPVTEDDIRRASREEVCGYWAKAVRHPAWWILEPEVAELGLTAMARGRHAVEHGRLLTKTAAIAHADAPAWLRDRLRERRRGDPAPLPRLRTAWIAWNDARRTVAALRP